MNELKLKKCLKCGKIIQVISESNNSELTCCGSKMVDLKSNTEECAIEKHIPNYEIKDDTIIVKVNHVMEDEHYIALISLVKDDLVINKTLTSNSIASVEFPYISESTIYSYCNKHGLWKCNVE